MKNDIYRYTPERNWCREGMAIETGPGRLLDTFWDTAPHDSMVDHYLTDEERASAELVGNVDDFTRYKPFTSDPANVAGFDGYEEADRLVITSQHRLTKHMFIRKGAVASHRAIVEKARADVSKALHERDSAMRGVERARENLHFAETGRWPWQETS